ncbi:MAG: hypothetical protein IKG55_05700, partial [Solobacterium sp.]|nr:hypothetical protein [Solobacterium sp.]
DHKRGKSYAEWRDEKQGKKTVRESIRDEVSSISASFSGTRMFISVCFMADLRCCDIGRNAGWIVLFLFH